MRVEELQWEFDDPEDSIWLICTNAPSGLHIHQCLRRDDAYKDELFTEVGNYSVHAGPRENPNPLGWDNHNKEQLQSLLDFYTHPNMPNANADVTNNAMRIEDLQWKKQSEHHPDDYWRECINPPGGLKILQRVSEHTGYRLARTAVGNYQVYRYEGEPKVYLYDVGPDLLEALLTHFSDPRHTHT